MQFIGEGRTLIGCETATPGHRYFTHWMILLKQTKKVSGGLDSDIRGEIQCVVQRRLAVKSDELKLHFDDSVKPVGRHVTRIPFGLRERVGKKLDEWLELDIIEKVLEGQLRWKW